MAKKDAPVQHNEKDNTWTATDRKGKKHGPFPSRREANEALHEANAKRPPASGSND